LLNSARGKEILEEYGFSEKEISQYKAEKEEKYGHMCQSYSSTVVKYDRLLQDGYNYFEVEKKSKGHFYSKDYSFYEVGLFSYFRKISKSPLELDRSS
jgi:hypothetical protein